MGIVYKEESYGIMGACFEVYKEMGGGFLEAVYQECLCLEFGSQDILFQSQVGLRLSYKGNCLSQKYVPDFICHERLCWRLRRSPNWIISIGPKSTIMVHPTKACADSNKVGSSELFMRNHRICLKKNRRRGDSPEGKKRIAPGKAK